MAADGEQEDLGFVDKFKDGWTTVIPVGDPANLPPCPSGVSDMAKPVQVWACLCWVCVCVCLYPAITGWVGFRMCGAMRRVGD